MNKLLLAAAGSGKTTFILEEALSYPTCEEIMITTYTQSNFNSIISKLYEMNGCIPPNITIQTWFSFLIEHGIKPYQYWEGRISGMLLVSKRSGFRYFNKRGKPVYWGEKNLYKYYFTDGGNPNELIVYSDKLSQLAMACNSHSCGSVIWRMSKIWKKFYIDEVQDMTGYDLDVVRELLISGISTTLVGDPRQVVYQTHPSHKYEKYKGNIRKFIEDECKPGICEIDDHTLNTSYRNPFEICQLSGELYPEYATPLPYSKQIDINHPVLFLPETRVQEYLSEHPSVQLRYNIKTKVNDSYPVFSFGDSKGQEFDSVVIYPTKEMLKWLVNHEVKLEPQTRARLYVALTRTRKDLAIIIPESFIKQLSYGKFY
ncbi:MAG: TGBp1 family protein [Coriobacteriia bacterium]|nr:TGBp1 family protein [Coriobacteriia bacterium]